MSCAAHCDAAWCHQAQAQAQEAADIAASQGDPCLFALADTFHALLAARHQLTTYHQTEADAASASNQPCETGANSAERVDSGQHQPAAGAQPQQTAPGGAAEGSEQLPQQTQQPPIHTLLIKIDHMNNRGLYARTIKAWAADLKLTGECGLHVLHHSSAFL